MSIYSGYFLFWVRYYRFLTFFAIWGGFQSVFQGNHTKFGLIASELAHAYNMFVFFNNRLKLKEERSDMMKAVQNWL